MKRAANIRRRTWEVLEVGAEGDTLSRTIDVMIMALVFGNVLAVVLESMEPVSRGYHDLFIGFEKISVAAFSAELLLRIWSVADSDEPQETQDTQQSHGRKRLRYLCSPMAIVDVLAIAPFYLSAFFTLDLRFLRILRLLRIIKLTRYSSAFGRILEVYHLQRSALAAALFLMSIAIVLSASLVYAAEQYAQPESFSSIPAAMWWAVCTLTTVGYGDVSPITPLGKFLAAGIQIIGIAMVALPTSLFAAGFAHVMTRAEQTLEEEAEEVLADGVITENEALAYAEMAERLHIDPEVAEEIIDAVRHRQSLRDLAHDCPHCGKALAG
jgi:voltage-gated potassium channel